MKKLLIALLATAPLFAMAENNQPVNATLNFNITGQTGNARVNLEDASSCLEFPDNPNFTLNENSSQAINFKVRTDGKCAISTSPDMRVIYKITDTSSGEGKSIELMYLIVRSAINNDIQYQTTFFTISNDLDKIDIKNLTCNDNPEMCALHNAGIRINPENITASIYLGTK